MDIILLLLRIVLAAVLIVAGIAKLRDLAEFRQTITAFGIPVAVASPLGALLPIVELAIGMALIPVAAAWWGATGALVLLLVFTAAIGVNLARGKKPDCNCFGQIHSSPIGVSTLVRNGLLAAAAALVVWAGWDHPGASVIDWATGLTNGQIIGILLAVAISVPLAAGAWFMLNLLRQQGRLLLRIEALETTVGGTLPTPVPAQPAAGLPVGTPAPAFELVDLEDQTHTLQRFLARGEPLLLIFSDPGCGPCTALMPDIARWQKDYTNVLTVILISRGGMKANQAKCDESGVQTLLLQKDREVAQAYKCAGTPGAVVVRPDGAVGSPLAMGAEAIKAQVARLAGRPTLVQPAAKVGEAAPAIKLPNLAGKTITLADLKRNPTVVLFWNPSCGFCAQMLDDLKAWERDRSKDAPKLLVVSTGSVEQNQAMNLRSPVVLDPNFSTGRTYSAGGTPSAVLVDRDGKVASDVATGAPAVLALLSTGLDTGQRRISTKTGRKRGAAS